MRIELRATVFPTEDDAKVAAAAHRFFPDATALPTADGLALVASDATAFRQRIWQQRTIDATRGALRVEGDDVVIRIDKQAAVAGHIAAAVGTPPLGAIEVRFRVEDGDAVADAEALIWWLCPETKDGAIVGPT